MKTDVPEKKKRRRKKKKKTQILPLILVDVDREHIGTIYNIIELLL